MDALVFSQYSQNQPIWKFLNKIWRIKIKTLDFTLQDKNLIL